MRENPVLQPKPLADGEKPEKEEGAPPPTPTGALVGDGAVAVADDEVANKALENKKKGRASLTGNERYERPAPPAEVLAAAKFKVRGGAEPGVPPPPVAHATHVTRLMRRGIARLGQVKALKFDAEHTDVTVTNLRPIWVWKRKGGNALTKAGHKKKKVGGEGEEGEEGEGDEEEEEEEDVLKDGDTVEGSWGKSRGREGRALSKSHQDKRMSTGGGGAADASGGAAAADEGSSERHPRDAPWDFAPGDVIEVRGGDDRTAMRSFALAPHPPLFARLLTIVHACGWEWHGALVWQACSEDAEFLGSRSMATVLEADEVNRRAQVEYSEYMDPDEPDQKLVEWLDYFLMRPQPPKTVPFGLKTAWLRKLTSGSCVEVWHDDTWYVALY
jgi:hypothetical protein